MIEHEVVIRLGCFIAIFVLMAVWETIKPCRSLSITRFQRWVHNLSLMLLNTTLLRIAFPAAALGAASLAQLNGWGLLNNFALPFWIATLLSVIIMDLVIYLQHVGFHQLPILWHIHRVHHADLDFDVTTGIRFHPAEILLSMLLKILTILLLGPSLFAVMLFEIILNGTAIFNHANVSLPKAVDRILRNIIVTPDMHRIHHSTTNSEMNHNFGFNFSFWDKCFKTYLKRPSAPQETMDIGLSEFRDPKMVAKLGGMLLMPLRVPTKEAPTETAKPSSTPTPAQDKKFSDQKGK